jgi:hypothetical protein
VPTTQQDLGLLIDLIGHSANYHGYEPLSGDYLRALYRMLAVIASGPGRYMLTSFCYGPEHMAPPQAQLSLGALVVNPQDHLIGDQRSSTGGGQLTWLSPAWWARSSANARGRCRLSAMCWGEWPWRARITAACRIALG